MALKKKERAGVVRRYTFKLYPTRAQNEALHETRRMMGDLWNALLQQREEAYRRQGRTLTFFDQSKGITALRAAFPEWRRLSSSSAAAVANRLDLAFKAFFAKAKRGAGGAYPQFVDPRRYSSIPNGAIGSGWTMRPTRGTPISYRKNGDYATWADTQSWRLYLKGIAGEIKMRGELPARPLKVLDSTVMWRDGAWWLSVSMEVPPRAVHGTNKITIRLDLIDVFARFYRVEGGSAACPKGRISQPDHEVEPNPGSDTHDLGAEQRLDAAGVALHHGSDTHDLGAEQRGWSTRCFRSGGSDAHDLGADQMETRDVLTSSGGSDAHDLGADQRELLVEDPNEPGSDASVLGAGQTAMQLGQCRGAGPDIDAIKSERDRRFKRGSRRWRAYTRRAKACSTTAARRNAHWLHNWSTAVVRAANALTVITPPIKAVTTSARGTRTDPGAAVGTVAKVNRHILAQAPATAIQMLKYKAAEAGITIEIVDDPGAPAAIGQAISKTAKGVRAAKRAVKSRKAA